MCGFFSQIQQIVQGPPKNLLEAVAEDIAAAVLERHATVRGIVVYIRKCQPPISGALESVGAHSPYSHDKFVAVLGLTSPLS
jgi:dihydroneopterin aldolase